MNDELPANEPTTNNMNDHMAGSPHGEATQEQIPDSARPSAGEQLRGWREARGWTAAQVANQLNLAPRQIDALEQDNYAALPGMVIVRGFIRSYAKILQVDAAPILAAINGGTVEPNVLPPARSEMSASFSETQLLSGQPRRGSFLKVVFGLVVILLLAMAALMLAQRMHWLPKKMAFSSSKIESELTQVALRKPVADTPAAAADESQVKTPSTDKPLPATKLAEKPSPAVPASAPVALAPAASTATASAATADDNATKSTPSPVSAGGKNALVIVAQEDSWLEIRQADDTILVSHILQAGSSETVNISKPVSVVIGNAAGVKVTFRGKPLDVVSGNSSNVARLNLK